MSKVTIKMGNYSGYHSKKLTSTIKPANLPKNQEFKLIIDILQDRICLFAEKDERNYEAIETLLTEQDIVNLVNQNPIVQINESSLVLVYEGFPKVELREVKQFTDTSQFKKTQQQSQIKQQSNNEVKPVQLAMPLEEMYEQLKQNYNEEINKYEQKLLERKQIALQESAQIKEKVEEMEKLKKDQKEFEAIKTLTVKTDFLEKEAVNYDRFIEQLQVYKKNQNKITQIEYLKLIFLLQKIEMIYQNYSLKRECLEKNLQLLLDDLRRHRIRKNTKEYEETEKRMTALAKEFQQLIVENEFITCELPKISERFLQGDESQIYSQKLDSLQQSAENSIIEAQQMSQQLQEKQKEVNEYRKKFDEIIEQNKQMSQDNEELKKQNQKVNQELDDNLEWKKKYLEITILMEELQAKHDTTLKQLEAGIFLKDKEIKFYKNQVYEKYQVIQELEKQGNEKFRDQRLSSLQSELEKAKKENDQEILRREEIEIELEVSKDKIAELEIKIQYYDQQLTSYKLNETQMKQGQIAMQSVQNELKFANNEISIKEQKIMKLKQELQSKEGEVAELKGKSQKFFEENLKLKNENEILKVEKERYGIEEVNRKLERQMNQQ